jgi:hypothetical protein
LSSRLPKVRLEECRSSGLSLGQHCASMRQVRLRDCFNQSPLHDINVGKHFGRISVDEAVRACDPVGVGQESHHAFEIIGTESLKDALRALAQTTVYSFLEKARVCEYRVALDAEAVADQQMRTTVRQAFDDLLICEEWHAQ